MVILNWLHQIWHHAQIVANYVYHTVFAQAVDTTTASKS
ncbi:hypothetical protein MWLp12_1292 [Lactiplantibacillus plantarum]|nr:hypothetical protein MWLp12_1292 [Lactiplantibacillus plantarum]